MNTFASATVQASQGNQFSFARNVAGLTAPVTLFQVPVGEPARIDAVYLEAYTASVPFALEALVLSFTLADGTKIWSQPTPAFNNITIGIVACTWFRGGQDSAQLAGFTPANVEATIPTYANPPLPETVLPALALITLALWEDNDDGTGTVVIQNPSITYTPGTGPTSSTEIVLNTQPLLVAGPSS